MADPVLKNLIFCVMDKADYEMLAKTDFLNEHKKLSPKSQVGYRWNIAKTQVLLQISCRDDMWLKMKSYFAKIKTIIQTTEIDKIKKLFADKAWIDPTKKP
mgnify:FL=1